MLEKSVSDTSSLYNEKSKMDVFQNICDSEINFSITAFWDSGFEVKLGDEHNGIVAQTRVETWDEIAPWLRAEAMLHFPDRLFSRND